MWKSFLHFFRSCEGIAPPPSPIIRTFMVLDGHSHGLEQRRSTASAISVIYAKLIGKGWTPTWQGHAGHSEAEAKTLPSAARQPFCSSCDRPFTHAEAVSPLVSCRPAPNINARELVLKST